MFSSRHFQALKNGRSVGRHNFFTFFIFLIFLYQALGKTKKKQKRKEVSGDLFRDLGP